MAKASFSKPPSGALAVTRFLVLAVSASRVMNCA